MFASNSYTSVMFVSEYHVGLSCLMNYEFTLAKLTSLCRLLSHWTEYKIPGI